MLETQRSTSRTRRRIGAVILSSTIAVIGAGYADPGARSAEADDGIVTRAASDPCPSPSTRKRVGDERDRLCASIRTADHYVSGEGSVAGARIRKRRFLSRSGDEGGLLTLSGADDEAGFDAYVVGDGDGDVLVAYFPDDSLVQNYPGVEGYDPSLPTGLLVDETGELADDQMEGVAARADGPRAADTSGLTQIGSECFALTTDPGGNVNNSSHASYQACYRWYKPASGDSSDTWKWRQVWLTGSGHGGNTTHKLRQTRNHTWLNNNGTYDDYKPINTTAVPEDSGCITKTLTLGVQGSGFEASLSESFEICPSTFGPQHVDLLGSPPKFQFGWDGNKGCGGGNCSWIGNAGGFQGKWRETATFSFHRSIGLKWGIIAQDL